MWQTVIVLAAVALAAWFAFRRLRRSLDPKAPPACGCDCGSSCPAAGQPQSPGDILKKT